MKFFSYCDLALDSVFKVLWQNKDPFEEVEKLEGIDFRKVKTRRTFRFEVNGKGYFAKVHHGIGWTEILKNLFQFKLPVLGAANEFLALEKLHSIGVDTMTGAAYGRKGGINPAKQESFLITCELENMTSVEDIAKNGTTTQIKHILIRKIAESAAKMHAAGINHRDCYICHYLVNAENITAQSQVFVIDLHRAQIRSKVPFHYHVKDVAGLYFSSKDAGLSERDRLRFIARYCRYFPACRKNKKFWKNVEETAVKLYQKEQSKAR
jgi:heptose I phosphotransferase